MEVDQYYHYYHYLTHHIVPGPQNISYFIPLILLPTALLIPRKVLSKWQSIAIFMPAITLCLFRAWQAIGGVDVISVDVLLWSLYLLVLKDPWEDFACVSTAKAPDPAKVTRQPSREDENDDGSIPQSPALAANNSPNRTIAIGAKYPTTFLARLNWVGALLVSIRLNNWTINLASHDTHQPPQPAFSTRAHFVKHTLLSSIRGYLLLDLTSAYTHTDPYFQTPTIPITTQLPRLNFHLPPFLPQTLRSMIIGAQAWALISQLFYLPCLLPVGLNALGFFPDAWSPHTWAPYFGSPKAIFLHGIRGFWGQYWHQMMRHSCSAPGISIADFLGLRSRGLLRYAFITGTAFGLSGVVHMGLVPPEPLHAAMSANTVRVYVAAFFWVQPVGMVVEMLFERGLRGVVGEEWMKRNGGGRFRMAWNFVWVVGWFSVTMPLLGEAGRQLGYWRGWIVPWSLWKVLRGEDAVAWPILKAMK